MTRVPALQDPCMNAHPFHLVVVYLLLQRGGADR